MTATALVVIDLQNDFCTGPAAAGRHRRAPTGLDVVADNAVRAVAAARSRAVELVHVRFTGDAEHQGPSWRRRDLLLGKAPKCREGSWGAEFHRVRPVEGERVFTKRARFDAFLAEGFEDHLREKGVEHLVFAGLYTDVCVDTSARSAFQRGFHVSVLTDCTTSLHLTDEAILSFMSTLYGARLMTLDDPEVWSVPATPPETADSGGQVVERGVARTSLMVAAARAIETHRHDSLARDDYAEHFVRAAGTCENWPVRPHEVPAGDEDPLWGRLGRYFGLRTRVLDDFVQRSVHAGARQAVLLGAGLDTRAFRLDWPRDCVVFELDQDPVLGFKQDVLDRLGATPRTRRVPVAVDFRQDWETALAAAGFDPTSPSVWLAEGLMLYLPSDAERRLIDAVDRLGVRDSSIAFEVKLGSESPQVRSSTVYSLARQRIGVDLLSLFDAEPRPDSAGYLASRGWATEVTTPFDFARSFGRGPEPQADDALASNRWIFATRT
ncbi:SAM-dependent methyltransferase [Lentzea sp. NPDC060358]|uniref:SAM-dependent methyltransferase n=1 Tax=Lentzea sp. NPDC060358 TaxID=3347103 RepID=UPI00365B42FE